DGNAEDPPDAGSGPVRTVGVRRRTVILLVVRLCRNGVNAGHPAVQIDVPAAPRAEGLERLLGGAAADRTGRGGCECRHGETLERFRATWIPVRVKKTPHIKTRELCF